jgi:hypothetical protein
MSKKPVVRRSSATGLVIGRTAAAKINAVEGIRLTPDMRRMFKEFDEQGLTAPQRRRLLAQRFGKKVG